MAPKNSEKRSFSILNFFSTGSSTSSVSESKNAGSPQTERAKGKRTTVTRQTPTREGQGSAADPFVLSDDEPPPKKVKVSAGSSGSGNADVVVATIPADKPKDESLQEGGDDDPIRLQQCPVCQAVLSEVPTDSEAHVNACLDRRPITAITHTLDRAKPQPVPKAPNAFSVLMNGHKEKEVWKEAVSEERRDGRRGPRKAPFYKILTGMPIAVDAFAYGSIPHVTAYFLTHAHSDHYTNLSKSWRHGKIYCSHTTANLVILKLGVDPQWVHGLPDDTPFTIPNTGGVTVTLIEANHCPGSSLFLFEGPQTVDAGDSAFRSPFVGSKRVFRYLHCGDFRACPKHILHPAVARAKLDTVYLDTTYLNPQYCFPPQPLVIEACAALAKRAALGDELPTEASVKDETEDAGTMDAEDSGWTGDVDCGETLEDVKPDIGDDLAVLEQDIKQHQSPNNTGLSASKMAPASNNLPDTKPGLPDQKPILHPVEIAFAEQDRSASMMEGWLVKKEPTEALETPKAKGRTLVLIGTYSIGKERIVKAIAKALGSKIYCNPRKHAILMCQADEELHSMLDEDPTKCQVHIVPLNHISLEHLQPYLDTLKSHFGRILAFRPTGWTYRPPAGTNTLPDVNFVIKRDQARGFSDVSLRPIRGSSRQFMMFGVPYSEHSSFFELTCFALSIPGDVKIIATVNVHTEKSRLKMRSWFDKWAAEKARRKERGQPSIVDYRDETYW